MATKTKTASKKTDDGPKLLGKHSGKNIRGTWVDLFVKNERAPKADKLTDAQLQAEMRKEFPGRESVEFTDPKGVKSVRRGYNHGVFTEGEVPKTQSHEFTKDGDAVPTRDERAAARREGKAPGRKAGAKEGRRPGKRAGGGRVRVRVKAAA